MLNAQCSMLNAQCAMLNAQCSMLNAQCSILNAHIVVACILHAQVHPSRVPWLSLPDRRIEPVCILEDTIKYAVWRDSLSKSR